MTNVPAFILRIARNLCINAKRRTPDTLPLEEWQFPVQPSTNEKTELLELITRALDLLPFEYREAFILREYDGLPYAEIAVIVDASVSAVKVRVFRARAKIRHILAPYITDLSK